MKTIGFVFVLIVLSASLGADDKSLDKKLLDDLGADLLDDLDNIPPAGPIKADEPISETDERLLDQLGEGEDIELGKSSDPLTRVGQKMRTVEQLIGGRRTSTKTQGLQREILDDLAVLIEMQKKKCAACKKGGKPKSGKPGDQANAQGKSDGAKESTTRLGSADVQIGDQQSREEFLKELWGNLPEKYLLQIQNASDEEFLPKYADLITEYFKRLTEDRENP